MSFPGHYQVPREVDFLGVRDVGLNAYVNGFKYACLLRDELVQKAWPMPEDIKNPADIIAFNNFKAALETSLNDVVANLKGIIDLVAPAI